MDKKQAIQSAAIQLLAINGIHATPMSAIAKEAGTGMGTIYNYFPNKELLINEIYISIKQAEKSIFDSFDGHKALKTQFENYYKKAIQFYQDNPLYFKFIEQVQASPIITSQNKELAYEAISSVIELIEKGKKDRVIKKIPTIELIHFVGGTIISFLTLNLSNTKKSPASIKNQMQMVWDAIKE